MHQPLVSPTPSTQDAELGALITLSMKALGCCSDSVLTMSSQPEIGKSFVALNKAVMVNHGRVTFALKHLVLTLILWLVATSARSQDVLRLEPGQQPASATLADVAWLAGHWVGTGLGGDCDETWLPATDNAMPGIFRYHRGDTLVFSEYMMIEALDGSLAVKLKHFNRDLSPWEEKDRWITFRLVRVDGQTAYFSGLTYHREGDMLLVRLSMRTAQGPTIEEFRFRRKPL